MDHKTIGIMLIALGLFEPVVLFLVVMPRVPPMKRGVLAVAFAMSSAILLGVGGAFYTGLI